MAGALLLALLCASLSPQDAAAADSGPAATSVAAAAAGDAVVRDAGAAEESEPCRSHLSVSCMAWGVVQGCAGLPTREAQAARQPVAAMQQMAGHLPGGPERPPRIPGSRHDA